MKEITSHKYAGDGDVQAVVDDNVRVTRLDDNDLVTGGCHDYLFAGGAYRRELNFQNGPLSVNGVNGVTNESVIAVLIDRLEGFQQGRFKCEENGQALGYLRLALNVLNDRTLRRRQQGVAGQLAKHNSTASFPTNWDEPLPQPEDQPEGQKNVPPPAKKRTRSK